MLGCTVERRGKLVGTGLPGAGVTTPAGGSVPLEVGTGSIDVDRNEDNIVFAEAVAPAVDAADAGLERDVVEFGDKELRVVAECLEAGHHRGCNLASVLIFAEPPIGRTLARRLATVTVVDKDLHCAVKSRLSISEFRACFWM